MSLIDLVDLVLFGTAVLCGGGVLVCRGIMLADLPLGTLSEIEFPRASWNASRITKLYRQYHPESRVPKINKLLSYVGVSCMGVLGMIFAIAAFTNPPHR